ncbi:MAG: M14 family metallopeptidase [Xanthomonadales bacterium]|nr:M14 family metallopeptidase [Xanthomonadales bacterium]
MKHPFLVLILLASGGVDAKRPETPAEAEQLLRTPTAAATYAFIDQLDAMSDRIAVKTFGVTPEGRALKVVIVGEAKPDREVVFVQAGIHAGEIEGKDAGLILLSEVAAKDKRVWRWLDHVTLVYVPIFNLDGPERSSKFNRINQNGPVEMGWRATSQRLNLNRDYIKADAPEMRALLALINDWNPDILIDSHTTNGADYQYDLTWSMDMDATQHPRLRAWQDDVLIGRVQPRLEKMGHLIAPYIEMNDATDPTKGFTNFGAGPRYSTGYAVARGRVGLLLETHMLKSYPVRVRATYDVITAILDDIAAHPGELRAATRQVDVDTAVRAANPEAEYPIQLANAGIAEDFAFKGFEWTITQSEVSGDRWIRYDPRKPKTFTVPFYRQVKVAQSVSPPAAYVIPAQWTRLVDRLQIHGVKLSRVAQGARVSAEVSLLSNPQYAPASFEGRIALSAFTHARERREMPVPAGSWLVPMDQPLANIALHILEPDAPDSALRWGDFNSIFEQREYADARVAEQLARDLMAKDPKLKAEFEAKLAAEPDFAKNPYARLNWFVQKSDWREWDLGLYPVLRLDAAAMKSLL